MNTIKYLQKYIYLPETFVVLHLDTYSSMHAKVGCRVFGAQRHFRGV